MNQGKKEYDSIVIPEELSLRVNQAIASVDKEAAVKRARVYGRAGVCGGVREDIPNDDLGYGSSQ